METRKTEKTQETNDVSSFFYYMWNRWSKEECEIAFRNSNCNWQHFWEKWCGICERHGVWGAAERFFAELSESNKDLLVQRAVSCYDRGKRIGDAV